MLDCSSKREFVGINLAISFLAPYWAMFCEAEEEWYMQRFGVTNTNNNLLSGNFHISHDNRDGWSDLMSSKNSIQNVGHLQKVFEAVYKKNVDFWGWENSIQRFTQIINYYLFVKEMNHFLKDIGLQ